MKREELIDILKNNSFVQVKDYGDQVVFQLLIGEDFIEVEVDTDNYTIEFWEDIEPTPNSNCIFHHLVTRKFD